MMFAYCHIPKTAGTTLNYILRKNFGEKLIPTIVRNGSDYQYNDLKLDKRIYKNARCISGHGLKPFIDYKEFNDEMQWFTFVREPIKRFVSQYIHQQTSALQKYHLPIEEWSVKYSRSNWLVKWIAGEENLEKAIDIINQKFIFIGLVENFDDSLQLMRKAFNLDLDLDFGKPKMVVRDNTLKTELLKNRYDELLPFYLNQNKLDIQFYEYIKNEFIPRINKGLENRTNLKKSSNLSRIGGYSRFRLKQNIIYKPYVSLTR